MTDSKDVINFCLHEYVLLFGEIRLETAHLKQTQNEVFEMAKYYLDFGPRPKWLDNLPRSFDDETNPPIGIIHA